MIDLFSLFGHCAETLCFNRRKDIVSLLGKGHSRRINKETFETIGPSKEREEEGAPFGHRKAG